MRTVAVVQARMGSSRLRGKVLADVGGRSMLARVVRRTARARRLAEVVVATTTGGADDPVAAEAAALGAGVFRGGEDDVLDRYHRAAGRFAVDLVVRITADCPLIDPEVIDRVVAAATEADGVRPDYASTTLERTLPRGLDVEAFTAEALAAAWREAREPYQRAHVTPYLYEHPERFTLLAVAVPAPPGAAGHRWTVDTAEDLELVRALYRRLGDDDAFGWRDALRVVETEPHLAEINRGVRQKALQEG
jgi:spore coat polysaccharide biosynthesis protein SpsF